jgi:acylglycerol lipase
MKYTIWGTELDLDFPLGKFPPMEKLTALDSLFPPTMKHDFFRADEIGGTALHSRTCLPKKDVPLKGILVWQHGIASHSGCAFRVPSSGRVTNYALLASEMSTAGYGVYLMDMRGHGLSEGQRFYIPGDWKVNRDDFAGFVLNVAQQHPAGTPLFVGGDSYGGNLAIHVGKLFQDKEVEMPEGFRGLCLTAPAIVGDLPPAPVTFVLRNVLMPISPTWIPSFMPNPINPDAIWTDPEVKALQTAPEVNEIGLQAAGKPFCLGTADGLVTALEHAQAHGVVGLDVPFCVAHGVNDGGVPITGTEDYLLKKCNTAEDDRLFLKEENAKHDLLAEPNAEEITAKIIAWMDSRLDKKYSPK